jgi:hypothetical protein
MYNLNSDRLGVEKYSLLLLTETVDIWKHLFLFHVKILRNFCTKFSIRDVEIHSVFL